MIATLLLPDCLRAQMKSEARDAFPRECCGLIEGRRDGETIHAIVLHPARNLSADTDRFEIDPADHFAALRVARASGCEIVGCYHSHPNGKAEISQRDRESALDDRFVWLICAVAPEEVRIAGFIRENGQFRALEVRETHAA